MEMHNIGENSITVLSLTLHEVLKVQVLAEYVY